MKTILSTLTTITIAAFFTACSSNPQTGDEGTAATNTRTYIADTSGLAEFQAWKSYKADMAASEYRLASAQPAEPAIKPAVKKPAATSKTSSANNRSTSNDQVSNTSNTSTAPVAQKQKKGWSKAAKGAAIGAGSGAVIGAVVNKKNRVAGGVIGGVVGAGVGYGIGRTMDKKDGRY
jgi:hypothetical protein